MLHIVRRSRIRTRHLCRAHAAFLSTSVSQLSSSRYMFMRALPMRRYARRRACLPMVLRLSAARMSRLHSLCFHLPCRLHPCAAACVVHSLVRSTNSVCSCLIISTSALLCFLSLSSPFTSHHGTAPPTVCLRATNLSSFVFRLHAAISALLTCACNERASSPIRRTYSRRYSPASKRWRLYV